MEAVCSMMQASLFFILSPKEYLKKGSPQVLELFHILQSRNAQNYTKDNAQEGGKQYPVFLGQQKGNGLGRDPE